MWHSGASGSTLKKTGKIVRVLPPGEVPESAAIRKPGAPRDHVSYVVRADNGRLYWPRAAALQRDVAARIVRLSFDDCKLLDWLQGQLGGAGCDHVLPLLERLTAGTNQRDIPRKGVALDDLDGQQREQVDLLLHVASLIKDTEANQRNKLAEAIEHSLAALHTGRDVNSEHYRALEAYVEARWTIGLDFGEGFLMEKGKAFLEAVHALIEALNKKQHAAS